MSLPSNQFPTDLPHPMDYTEEEKDQSFEGGAASRLRKHVTSACFPCKNGKVKCDGNRPCARCHSKSLLCTYRSDEDGRSRIPMRRKIEKLERDNTLLNQLVDQIREANDIEVRQIASLIRSNAPLDEVNATIQRLKHNATTAHRPVNPIIEDMYLTTGRALSQYADLGLDTARSKLQLSILPEPASRVLSVTRLIDEPLYQVPAAPWTAVSKDSHLISHLISLWAVWYHLLPDGIVLEPFLAAMKAAKLDSLLCSPFLVNCVLAAGCLFSDYDEAKTIRGRASGLMNAFVKEAEWHLGQDASTPSITNVQGLCILYVVVSQLNRDRDGYHYAIRAATLSAELLRARERILLSTSSSDKREEITFVLDTACWGVYSATSGSMLAWMRPQLIAKPGVPFPKAGKIAANFHTSAWSPYPRTGSALNIQLDDSLRHHYALAILTAEMTHRIFPETEPRKQSLRKEVLHDLHVSLIFWYAKLPEYMKQASPGCPSVTMLLIWYHGIVSTLLKAKIEFGEYDERKENSSDSISGRDEDDDDGDDDENDAQTTGYVNANRCANSLTDEEHLLQHALRIAGLFRSNRDTYEYSRFHCFMCQPGRVALYILMEQNHDHRYDADITELFTAMRAMSRRFPFTFTLLRMTQLDLHLRNLNLPASAEKLFEEYEQLEGPAWKERGTVNSVYPSPQLFAGPYADESSGSRGSKHPTDMIEFLKIFDGLRLG